MMSLEEIKRMNADAGHIARGRRTKPFLLKYIGQLDSMPPFPFPNFGDKAKDMDKNKKFKRVDSLFCDSSGFGAPGEPALTIDQLKSRMRGLFEEHGPLLFAIEWEGEFQVYVGVWKELS